MFPHERSLVEKFAGKPFVIIGVNSDRDLDKVRPKFVEEKITWRSFWCGAEGTSGAIPTQWNVHGWPTLFLIDHDGVIQNKWLGAPRGTVLDDRLDELVGKAEAAAGK